MTIKEDWMLGCYDSDSDDESDSGIAFVIDESAFAAANRGSESPCSVEEEYEDWQVQPWMCPVTGKYDPSQKAIVPLNQPRHEAPKPKYYSPLPPTPTIKPKPKSLKPVSVNTTVKVANSPAPISSPTKSTATKVFVAPQMPKSPPKERLPAKKSSRGCQWCGTPESSLWRKHPKHGTICTACYASNRRWGEIRRPRAVSKPKPEIVKAKHETAHVKKAKIAKAASTSSSSKQQFQDKKGSISPTSEPSDASLPIGGAASPPAAASIPSALVC